MPVALGEVEVRQRLTERMLAARAQCDALFRIVRPHALYERPISERHRIVFYIGHLEAFDWNLLHERVLGLQSFHPEFDRLFAFGIDPVGGGLPTDQPKDWPTLELVHEYLRKVRETLDSKLADAVAQSELRSSDGFSIDTLLNVAIEHRLMHAETLAYMFHQLPLEQKIPQATAPSQHTSSVKPAMIEIPAGTATLGLSRSSETFGWDNEYELHQVEVPAFEIDQYMVTNGLYLEFMQAGGYETRSYWDDAAWEWRSAHAISHPVFWNKASDGWRYRTMFAEVPLPLDWPLYVSHAEATAYARWAGKSLPTEAEWHRAAYGALQGNDRSYPWGNQEPESANGNFDFASWDPVSVSAFPKSQSAFGVHGMLGNGWEWTCTVFGPFPRFERFPFYPGYSADFFDGKHFVMKGGSARTACSMVRPTFRNWFQAHYQYVYAGFRCVNR